MRINRVFWGGELLCNKRVQDVLLRYMLTRLSAAETAPNSHLLVCMMPHVLSVDDGQLGTVNRKKWQCLTVTLSIRIGPSSRAVH